jgi:hypothetical protein
MTTGQDGQIHVMTAVHISDANEAGVVEAKTQGERSRNKGVGQVCRR